MLGIAIVDKYTSIPPLFFDKFINLSYNANMLERAKTILQQKLREICARYKWTQGYAGFQCGLSPDEWKALVKGRIKDPRISTLLKIARTVNMSLDELVGHHVAKHPKDEILPRVIGEDIGQRYFRNYIDEFSSSHYSNKDKKIIQKEIIIIERQNPEAVSQPLF